MNGTMAEVGMEGGDPAILTRAAAMGRGGDSMMAHVTPGDFVVPRDAWMEDPGILQRVKKVMEESGADYRSHMVGSGYESINPETGQPEFGFFSFKNILHTIAPFTGGVKNIIQQAPATIGALVGGPLGALAASGISSSLSSQPKQQQGPAPAGPPAATNAPVTRQAEAALPSGLGDFAGLDPLQRSTGLATKGLNGGGIGQDEQSYFLNQINRRLIDDQGQYGDINSVTPVEKGYLENGLGLQFDPTAKSLLQSIANRQARV